MKKIAGWQAACVSWKESLKPMAENLMEIRMRGGWPSLFRLKTLDYNRGMANFKTGFLQEAGGRRNQQILIPAIFIFGRWFEGNNSPQMIRIRTIQDFLNEICYYFEPMSRSESERQKKQAYKRSDDEAKDSRMAFFKFDKEHTPPTLFKAASCRIARKFRQKKRKVSGTSRCNF